MERTQGVYHVLYLGLAHRSDRVASSKNLRIPAPETILDLLSIKRWHDTIKAKLSQSSDSVTVITNWSSGPQCSSELCQRPGAHSQFSCFENLPSTGNMPYCSHKSGDSIHVQYQQVPTRVHHVVVDAHLSIAKFQRHH